MPACGSQSSPGEEASLPAHYRLLISHIPTVFGTAARRLVCRAKNHKGESSANELTTPMETQALVKERQGSPRRPERQGSPRRPEQQGSPRRPQLPLESSSAPQTDGNDEQPSHGTSRSTPVPLPLYVEEPSTRAKEYRPRFISWRKIGLCIVVFPWSLVAGAWYVGRLIYKEASDQPVTVMGLTGIGILSVGIFLTAFVLCIGKRLDRMARTRRLRMILGSRIAAFSPRVMAHPGFPTTSGSSKGSRSGGDGGGGDYSLVPNV